MKPTMNFLEAVKTCFGKYVTFSGRARRSEFWWFYLLGMVPGWIMGFLINLKMAKKAELLTAAYQDLSKYNDIVAQAESFDTFFYIGMAVAVILNLALFIPMLAAWVRRLHDVGKSGHMLWLILVCGVGGIIPLIMCISDSKPGPNQYGPNPKE
ncbi:MAG: DUF805 domain-containing protein [Bacteroidales bacterium]|nr:DUF805 domain-containing protein [Bacteroidales bacterium]